MNWEDEGYLLKKTKFRENANIINVFTETHGKVSGIVYGGNSRKIKNYLQIGNKIFLIFKSNNANKPGYLKTEIINAISPKYFDDKLRSYCILSITDLLNSLLPESQSHKKLYNSLNNMIKNLDHNNWPIMYIFWELNLIKELGFGLELNKTNSENDLITTEIDNVSYEIPKFIINEITPSNYSSKLITDSLVFTRNLLLNKFFLPNDLIFPRSRVIFENYFN